MSLTNIAIRHIMSWRNFNRASTKSLIDSLKLRKVKKKEARRVACFCVIF
jgi:hypothetical protein